MVTLVLLFVSQVNVYPQNPVWDRYTIIPPLGTIHSITASDLNVFAASDQYLLFFNKLNYTFEKSVRFDCELTLIGYDKYTNDIWIVCPENIIRFNTLSFTLRAYPISEGIQRFALDMENVYFEGVKTGQKYALDKVIGTLTSITNFPVDLKWVGKSRESDIRQYPFLNPYYYYDDVQVSQTPFERYSITAIYDDGMYLYVGTDRYGLVKYNKTSWQKQRIVYGPVDPHIKKVEKFNEKVYFLCASGISYFHETDRSWKYLRLNRGASDLTTLGNEIFLARNNQLIRTSGTLEFPIGGFTNDILSLGSDSSYIYAGTRSGLFRIAKSTSTEIPFGPQRYAVYYVYPTEEAVYAAGEFALYKYSRGDRNWTTVLGFGVKDIVGLKDEIYALGTNNQIMRVLDEPADSLAPDTGWVLLPFFNIYDIDADDEVLYCATYSGMYYYEPEDELYRIIYNLPRIQYDYVAVIDDQLIAVGKNSIYSLPLEHRD
jgi:hypothetical protein